MNEFARFIVSKKLKRRTACLCPPSALPKPLSTSVFSTRAAARFMKVLADIVPALSYLFTAFLSGPHSWLQVLQSANGLAHCAPTQGCWQPRQLPQMSSSNYAGTKLLCRSVTLMSLQLCARQDKLDRSSAAITTFPVSRPSKHSSSLQPTLMSCWMAAMKYQRCQHLRAIRRKR